MPPSIYDDAPTKMPMGKGMDMDMGEDMESEEESSIPPEFDAAYDEWEADPSRETMYRMIEACKGGGGGGGLAILLGKDKGKK